MTATPQDVTTVLAALPVAIRLSLGEPGRLGFRINQDAADPCVFHVAERIKDRAAFDARQAHPRQRLLGGNRP